MVISHKLSRINAIRVSKLRDQTKSRTPNANHALNSNLASPSYRARRMGLRIHQDSSPDQSHTPSRADTPPPPVYSSTTPRGAATLPFLPRHRKHLALDLLCRRLAGFVSLAERAPRRLQTADLWSGFVALGCANQRPCRRRNGWIQGTTPFESLHLGLWP
ncbi:hypothetical protein BDW60DRAFT_176402 [Aspergillus nidulans var. acristatus]